MRSKCQLLLYSIINSFESANSMIMMFVFFYNFIRPHSSLSDLTPAQVAGLKYSERQQNSLLLVSRFSPNEYSNGRTVICHRACVSTFIFTLDKLQSSIYNLSGENLRYFVNSLCHSFILTLHYLLNF